MNLWLVNHYANAPSEPGDARHFSHARELMRRGHSVRVIACSFHHLTHRHMTAVSGRAWEHSTVEGVPFTWIRARSYQANSAGRIVNMFEFAWRAWRRSWTEGLTPPDLVLGSSPDPFAALAAERIAAHYGAPFVLEVRDLWPYFLTEVGGHSTYHPFVMLVDKTMRYLYRRAASIVMFSRDSRGLLVAYGADPEKILWVPHGVDLTLSPPPRPAPEDGVFTVTYIGAHNEWNGLGPILDAAKMLQEKGLSTIAFRFVGDGVSRPELEKRLSTEGIRNATFLGAKPKNEIPGILHTSDAFILNNRVDGVSKAWMSFNKLYEYLSSGRPVVFGSCTDLNPVQESGAGVLVEAGNAVQMAQAVETLASMSSERLQEYGSRGRRHIEEHYSVRSLVERFEKMAFEVTGSQHGPEPKVREIMSGAPR